MINNSCPFIYYFNQGYIKAQNDCQSNPQKFNTLLTFINVTNIQLNSPQAMENININDVKMIPEDEKKFTSKIEESSNFKF
jgi:hypothetical protein